MYKTLWLMVIKVGDKWCKATTTWKFWWNFLAKSILFSRYPSFSPFERPDAYKCYIFSESYGSRETREIKISTSKFDLEARGILSSLWTQTGPWSDTASYLIQSWRHDLLTSCYSINIKPTALFWDRIYDFSHIENNIIWNMSPWYILYLSFLCC